ncbi:winged helix-turn-helix transcriptional regulator [Tsuneonella sp. HG222]
MGHLHENLREIVECGLPGALEVIGDKWSFMILRAGFNGFKHFDSFQAELGIARNILSNRLQKLVENGIFKREPCEDDKRKIEYRLTEKAIDLLPAMIALRQWGEKYTSKVPPNLVLVDSRDRKPIEPVRLHAHDGRPLVYSDLDWEEAGGKGRPDLPEDTC